MKRLSFMDYFTFGQGEKTLVILPGLSVQSVMGAAEAVANAYRAFHNDFTVYVFDRRKELPPSYTVNDMAEDAAAAIAKIGLNRVSVFGASQGGMIALKMATEHPELVEKLVVCSTPVRVTKTEFTVIEKWVRLAEAKNAVGLYSAFGEAVYPEPVFHRLKEDLIKAALTVTEKDLARFTVLARGANGFDVTRDLGKISCPVLAIADDADRVFSVNAVTKIGQYLNARPNFTLYTYHGYGHAAYDTAPDFKKRMLRFLTSDPAR